MSTFFKKVPRSRVLDWIVVLAAVAVMALVDCHSYGNESKIVSEYSPVAATTPYTQ